MNAFEQLLTSLICITSIIPILKKYVGKSWLFLIFKSFISSGKLFKKTSWYKKKNQEAIFVKSMILLPVFYNYFKEKYDNEKALEIMNEIIIKVSHTVDYANSKKNNLFNIDNPFERWLKYRSILITDSFGPFNDIQDIYIHNDRIHLIVKRCIFNDFFKEVGAPELTVLMCNYDQIYHNAVFKEYYFDRNGSWQNTIGYGAKVCHYVWKDKNVLTKQFKDYLAKKSKNNIIDEHRKNDRRQFERRNFERRQFDRRR